MTLASTACFNPDDVPNTPAQTDGITDGGETTGTPGGSGVEPGSTAGPADATTVDSADTTNGDPLGICGDGILDGGEACDDGNTTDGDGCSAGCLEEPGFNCTGQPSVCTVTCGNGTLEGGETCDDGNVSDGDGCSAVCISEPGFDCAGEPSTCASVCGDGVIVLDEECDDGNSGGGDGCTRCAVDPGFACRGEPSVCSSPCGDGMVGLGEGCDDGGMVDGDGCSASCTTERYFRCVGEGPGSCAPIRTLYAVAFMDDAAFRMATSAITGGPVDYLDATIDTPSAAMLEADYDCVWTHPGFDFADSPTLGGALAGFVDSGGSVVLGFGVSYPPPIGLGGTPIMQPGYSPIIAPAAVDFGAFTYAGDGAGPIHQDVVSYVSQIVDNGVMLQGMGVPESSYTDGRIASAHRPDLKVVYLNGTGHDGWTGSGDWPRLVANSCAVGFLGMP